MRHRVIYVGALATLAVLWVFFLAVPNLAASQTSLGQRLGKTVVSVRLSNLGFTKAQAESATHELNAERLAALAGGLGTPREGSPLVGIFAFLSLMSVFALIILT